MLKRSPGPKVRGMPSSTIGLPEGSFLVDIVTECSYPSRKEEGTLDGTLQEFWGLDSSHLAQVAILVQTITSEYSSGLDAVVFIHWFCLVMSCWLGTVSLTINLIVPQLTNPRKCWSLPVPPPISREEIVLVLLPWGSNTDHPRSLPASPEASGVDDVVRRCPPQGTQTDSELSTIFSVAPYALKVLWSEGTLAAWPQPGTSLFVPFSEGKIGRTVLLF